MKEWFTAGGQLEEGDQTKVMWSVKVGQTHTSGPESYIYKFREVQTSTDLNVTGDENTSTVIFLTKKSLFEGVRGGQCQCQSDLLLNVLHDGQGSG